MGIFNYEPIPGIVDTIASTGAKFAGTAADNFRKSVVRLSAVPNAEQRRDPTPIAWLGPVPVGFQFGTYFGVEGFWSSLLVDIATDPTTYLNFGGSAAARSFFGLTKAGIASKVEATAIKSIKDAGGGGIFKKLGLINGLNEGANAASKIKNLKRVFEFGEALNLSPRLAEGAKKGLGLLEKGYAATGKERKIFLREANKVLTGVSKGVRKTAGRGSVARQIFNKKNVEGMHALFDLQSKGLGRTVKRFGATGAERAARGQQKLLAGFIPFTKKRIFEVTGAPLLAVTDKLPSELRAVFTPFQTGSKVLDSIAERLSRTQVDQGLPTVDIEELKTLSNKSLEALTGHRIARSAEIIEETDDGTRIIKDLVEGESDIASINELREDRLADTMASKGSLHETVAVVASDMIEETDRFHRAIKGLMVQTYGPRVAEGKMNILGSAWESVPDAVTGINDFGLRVEKMVVKTEDGADIIIPQFYRATDTRHASDFARDFMRDTKKLSSKNLSRMERVEILDRLGNKIATKRLRAKQNIDNVTKMFEGVSGSERRAIAERMSRTLKGNESQIKELDRTLGKIERMKRFYAAGRMKQGDKLFNQIKSRLKPRAGGEAFFEGLDTARQITDSPGGTFFRDLSPTEMKGIDKFSDTDIEILNMLAVHQSVLGRKLQKEGLLSSFIEQYMSHMIEPTALGAARWKRGFSKVGGKIEHVNIFDTPVQLKELFESALTGGKGATSSAPKSILMMRELDRRELMRWVNSGEIRFRTNAIDASSLYAQSVGKLMRQRMLQRSLEHIDLDVHAPLVMNRARLGKRVRKQEIAKLVAQGLDYDQAVRIAEDSISRRNITELATSIRERAPDGSKFSYVAVKGFSQDKLFRGDIAKELGLIEELDPGGVFVGTAAERNSAVSKWLRGYQAINAIAKRTKLIGSAFHAFALTGSAWADMGMGKVASIAFDEATGKYFFGFKGGGQTVLDNVGRIAKTETEQIPSSAQILFKRGELLRSGLIGNASEYRVGALQGAIIGGTAGSGIADEGNEGSGVLGGAALGTVLGFAFGRSAAAAQVGRRIYGEAADMGRFMRRSGLMLNGPDAVQTDLLERMLYNAQMIKHSNIPDWMGRAVSGGAKAIGRPFLRFDRWLWNEYYAGMKAFAFSELFASEMHRTVTKNTAMTAKQIGQNVAAHVNAAFGGLNWRKLGIDRRTQRFLNAAVFAPDWTASNLIMARDVFANLSDTKGLFKSAFAGTALGGAIEMLYTGDTDSTPWRGFAAGLAGSLAFRAASTKFGHRLNRDIVRGTPLEKTWYLHQAAPDYMAKVDREIREAWPKSHDAIEFGKRMKYNDIELKQMFENTSFRNPVFESYYVEELSKRLSKDKKTLPEDLLDAWIKPDPGAEQRARLARSYAKRAAIAYGLNLFMVNYAFTGHAPWDNAPGHRAEIELPFVDDRGRRQYFKMGKQFKEPIEWAQSPGTRYASKISLGFRTSIDLLKNRDFIGAPIYATSDGIIAQSLDQSKYAAKSLFSPNFVEKAIASIEHKLDWRRAALEVSGFQTSQEFIRKRSRGSRRPSLGRIVPGSVLPTPPLVSTSLRPRERR